MDGALNQRVLQLLLVLACSLGLACSGGSTGGPQLPFVWPMLQRTANRAASAQVDGPTLGTVAWSVRLPDPGFGLIVTEADLVLVRSGENVSAYRRDGSLAWKQSVGASDATPMALPTQLIFVPTDAGVLRGLTREGSTSFSQVVTGRLTSPAFRHSRDIVVAHAASDIEGQVSILPPGGGPSIGSLAVGPLGTGSVAVDENDRAYIASRNGSLYQLDLREGLPEPVAGFTLALKTSFTRGTPSTRNGFVYVVDDGDRLYSVSDTGVLFWTFKPDVTTTSGGGSTPGLHGSGLIIYGTRDEHVYALRGDGTVAWRFDCGGAVSSPPVIDRSGRIYVRAQNGVVFALDGHGRKLFATPLADTITAEFDPPMALGSDGSLYVTTHDGRLVCLRDAPVWQQAGHDALHTHRTPERGPARALNEFTLDVAKSLAGPVMVGTDGRLVTRAPNGTIIAFDQNGARILERNPGAGDSLPALLPSNAVVAGTDAGELVGIGTAGQTLFRTPLGAKVGSPTITAAGTIVVATADGVVHTLSSDGTKQQSIRVGKVELAPPAVGGDESITLALKSGAVVRLAASGEVAFRATVGARVPGPIALAPNGDAIALTERDVMIAIGRDGGLKWFFDPVVPAGTGRGGPALAADGSIVFGDANGILHILEPDGRERLAIPLDAALTGPPAIDEGGRIYVTTGSVSAYAADGTLLFRRPPPPSSVEAPFLSGPTLSRAGKLVVPVSTGFIDVLGDRDPWPGLGGAPTRAHFTQLYGPRAPAVRFTVDALSGATASAAVSADGRTYVKAAAGDLIAIDASGAELWRVNVGGGANAPLITRSGRIIAASDGGRLSALDRGGRVQWFLELSERLTSPLAALDETILVAGRHTIFRVSAQGKLLDEVATPPLNDGALALSAGGFVAAATSTSTVVVFALGDPSDVRVFATPAPVSRCTPVWDRNQRLYLLTDRDQLACYTRNGDAVYLVDPGLTGEDGGRAGPAVEVDEFACFGTQDGRLFRVSPAGVAESIHQASAAIDAPPLIDGQGVIFATAGGQLFGLAADGSEIFPPLTLDPGAAPLGALAMSHEGNIALGSASGLIYLLAD